MALTLGELPKAVAAGLRQSRELRLGPTRAAFSDSALARLLHSKHTADSSLIFLGAKLRSNLFLPRNP